MSKRSRKTSMKVMENLEMEENYSKWRLCCILYIVLMLHPGLKIKQHGIMHHENTVYVNSSQEGEECKISGFTAPNGVISININEIARHLSS